MELKGAELIDIKISSEGITFGDADRRVQCGT
jgi:hypothetical protein